jgi:hypothetical protein
MKNCFLLFIIIYSSNFCIGQEKMISCLKQTFIHEVEVDERIQNFTRTICFETCDKNQSVSKSWQYSIESIPISYRCISSNIQDKQNIDIDYTLEQSGEISFTVDLTFHDTISKKYYHFYSYQLDEKITTLQFEIWNTLKDSIYIERYKPLHPKQLLYPIKLWLSDDMNINDSLSTLPFPDLKNIPKELISSSQEVVSPRYIYSFKPNPENYVYGEKKIPKHLKKNSKLLVRKRKLKYEKWINVNGHITSIYEIYFKE